MDVSLFSLSLPTSTRLTSLVGRDLPRGWRNNKIPQCCSNMGNSVNSISQIASGTSGFYLSKRGFLGLKSKRNISKPPRSNDSSSSSSSLEDKEDSSEMPKAPFGYSRKDVLLIGLGLTAVGVGLKYGLEFVGVDPLKAGNVVQLVMVLGLTIGWISTYIFRVSNKDMTYAKQLRDYEKKVMEKRLESLTEAELEALLEQVEEEKGS